MLKNTAGQRLVVLAWDINTQTPKTGDAANITAKLSKDGGTYTATSDTNPTELEQGRYAFDLTQAETNCDRWHLIPVSATANVFVSCEESSYTTTVEAGDLASIDNQLSIITAISGGSVTVSSALAQNGTITVYNNRKYGGSAQASIQFAVSKDYTAATSLELVFYEQSNATTEYLALTATATSSTLITATGETSVASGYFGTTGAIQCRYSLFANWGTDQETIATGKAVIYQQPE
jgi:hypothetical protein